MMNMPKITALAEELAALEASRGPEAPVWLDAQIALLRRRLRWHLLRAAPRRHPNVGTASLCEVGRPKDRQPYLDTPVPAL